MRALEHVFQDLQAQAGDAHPILQVDFLYTSETRCVLPSIVPFPIQCANSRFDVADHTSARTTSRLRLLYLRGDHY